jgi:hypothetical protein
MLCDACSRVLRPLLRQLVHDYRGPYLYGILSGSSCGLIEGQLHADIYDLLSSFLDNYYVCKRLYQVLTLRHIQAVENGGYTFWFEAEERSSKIWFRAAVRFVTPLMLI